MMMFFGFFFLVALAVLAWWLVQQQGGTPSFGGPREDEAMRIVRERYARGEISRDEYEERQRALER